MEELKEKTKAGIFQISANLSKETISFLIFMIRYEPIKRLNIDQLSRHKFIKSEVKDFTKIDK